MDRCPLCNLPYRWPSERKNGRHFCCETEIEEDEKQRIKQNNENDLWFEIEKLLSVDEVNLLRAGHTFYHNKRKCALCIKRRKDAITTNT